MAYHYKKFWKFIWGYKKNGNLITITDEEGLVTYSEKYYIQDIKKKLDLADFIYLGEKNKKV